MILSLIQTKGGTGKTTLATALAYSKLFRKRFESICLAELDPQGTISHWHNERESAGYPAYNIHFVTLLKDVQRKLTRLVQEHDALILDVPGESVGKFATRLAVSLSDVALIPMRSSTNDEQSFGDNILPVIREIVEKDAEKQGRFYIVPGFVHPQASLENITGYFREVMPEDVKCLDAVFPARSVYENFSRDGMTLHDYAKSVRKNARNHGQAKKAISDIETIAKKILSIKQ